MTNEKDLEKRIEDLEKQLKYFEEVIIELNRRTIGLQPIESNPNISLDRNWKNSKQAKKISKIIYYQSQIKKHLTDDLLKPGKGGHCYVASETYYHLMGGKENGLKAYTMKHENVQHWWVTDISPITGQIMIVDLTVNQFKKKPDYNKGICKGFLTKEPSKRAQKLMSRFPKYEDQK